jgi:PAS domain S-box-containing protein
MSETESPLKAGPPTLTNKRSAHKLSAVKIELEVQNEALRHSQVALNASWIRYFDLYNRAPVGYFTVSEIGLITETNLTAATLLGVSGDALINIAIVRFIDPEDTGRYFLMRQRLIATGQPQTCELRMLKPDGTPLWTHLSTAAAQLDDGASVLRLVLTDISERKRAEETLQESERRYRGIFENANTGIVESDPGGRLQNFNEAFRAMLGYEAAALNKMNFIDFTHPEDLLRKLPLLKEIRKNQRDTYRLEKRLLAANGRTFWIDLYVSTIRDKAGKAIRFIGVINDINERKLAEAALQISEQQLAAAALQKGEKFKQAILDSVSSQIAVLDHNGVIVAVNEAWRRFALENGVEPEKSALTTGVGVNYLALCQASRGNSRECALQARAGILQVLAGDLPSFLLEYPCHSPSHERWFSMSVTPMGVENEGVVIAHSDITDPKKQLRDLAAHQEGMLELERKHIAREVHDELGQLLTALKMDISLLRLRFGTNLELLTMTEEMRLLAEGSIKVVRQVASNLRPSALDLGLPLALDWLAENFTRRWSIPCHLEVSDSDSGGGLDDLQSTMVFRVIQESLTNIARHARAHSVFISLLTCGARRQVTIQDDGVGFTLETLQQSRSFGLMGMRERVLAVGGTLHIDSAPGKGTTVTIEFPLLNRGQA